MSYLSISLIFEQRGVAAVHRPFCSFTRHWTAGLHYCPLSVKIGPESNCKGVVTRTHNQFLRDKTCKNTVPSLSQVKVQKIIHKVACMQIVWYIPWRNPLFYIVSHTKNMKFIVCVRYITGNFNLFNFLYEGWKTMEFFCYLFIYSAITGKNRARRKRAKRKTKVFL